MTPSTSDVISLKVEKNDQLKKNKTENRMKIKYLKPTTKVFLIKGGKYLLTGGSNDGFQATMSGYEQDNDGDGFSQ